MHLAVQVDRVNYSIKEADSKTSLLKNVNLTVNSGSIFSLLGPSGCGKTTLLRCLVGLIKPSQGFVRVCGHDPHSSKFDKSLIGFMPQELALYDEFTAIETLRYFGLLYCMNTFQLEHSIESLLSFLDLTHCQDQKVDTLSGGQQRRLSLAISLIHEPKLAILDEPTVGVDPVLSNAIWQNLKVLADKGMTIIITTHYIEEAKDANEIAFMRDGSVLSQGSVQHYRQVSQSLEKVFLDICKKSERKKSNALENSMVANGKPDIVPVIPAKAIEDEEKRPTRKTTLSSYLYVTYILLWKNWMRVCRSIHIFFFTFMLPAIQLILFCTCIGNDPMNVQVAIVNEETDGQFSSLFLEKLPSFHIHQKKYERLEDAMHSVETTQSWGVLLIPKNFTVSLQKRIYNGEDVTSSTIQSSLIKVYADLTNKQLTLTLMAKLQESMAHFYLDVVDTLGLDKSQCRLPIEVSKPIYKREEFPGGFLQFMAPGIIVAIGYGMISSLTALAFVIERSKGLLERTLLTGATIDQILLASFLFHALIVLGQETTLIVFSFYYFQIQSHGPLYLVYTLLYLQGCAGIAFGLLIASLNLNESGSLGIIVGSLYPNMMITGVLWPLEAVPSWFKWISYTQPGTVAIISMRNIVLRGWHITDAGVYNGFITTVAFIVLFMMITRFKFSL